MKNFINSKIVAAKLKNLNEGLLSAAYKGDLEKVISILDSGAEIDYVKNGETALINAIRGQKENVVKELLHRGAYSEGIDESNSNGGIDPAITIAAMVGNEKIAKILLSAGVSKESAMRQYGIDDEPSHINLPPLHIAVLNRNEKMVRTLLDGGFDINYADENTGYTALMAATSIRNEEMIRILLGLGAEVNKCDVNEANALYYYHKASLNSRIKEQPAIVDLLLEAGINVKKTINPELHDLLGEVPASYFIPEQMKQIALMQSMFPDMLDENGRLKPEVEYFGKDQWNIILPHFAEALSMPNEQIKIIVQYLGLKELVSKIRPLIKPNSKIYSIFKKDPTLKSMMEKLMPHGSPFEKNAKKTKEVNKEKVPTVDSASVAIHLPSSFAQSGKSKVVYSSDEDLEKVRQESEQKTRENEKANLDAVKKARFETSHLKPSESSQEHSGLLSKSNSFDERKMETTKTTGTSAEALKKELSREK